MPSRKKIKEYLATHNHCKLHLGCGKNNLTGFLNCDIFNEIPIDITRKLPFQCNMFELIYSSHLIEHVSLNEFKCFLKENHRILKKDGKNIIVTPSLGEIVKTLYGNDKKT